MTILFAGCMQQPPQTPAPPPTQTPPSGNNQSNSTPSSGNVSQPQNQTFIGINQLYKFDSVKSYDYRMGSSAGGNTIDILYTVTPDTVNGTAAWLQEARMNSTTYKIWLDKTTYKCLKSTVTMGGSSETSAQCPQQDPYSSALQLLYVGKESVTVPAGTFNTDKYSSVDFIYWSASGVPVPVKIAYADGNLTMELVSYT